MSDTKQPGSSIVPEVAQELLDSASNAADKGMSAFYTPVEFGRLFDKLLPRCRTNIVDLTSGNGQLLLACNNESTKMLMGIDIDPCFTARNEKHLTVTKIAGDVTKVWQLLYETQWHADLFVLNPPFDLHWYRDRIEMLEHSGVPAVREAYRAGNDPRNSKKTMDSTIATMLIALDRMTALGEGLLIGNNATLKRLIFEDGSRYRALRHHVWFHHAMVGNPMTNSKGDRWNGEFETGIIGFARSHVSGIDLRLKHRFGSLPAAQNIAELKERIDQTAEWRDQYRLGVQVYTEQNVNPDTRKVFMAVKDEWATRTTGKVSTFNIRLANDGTIVTNLSTFEERSVKVDKSEIATLHSLAGQRPMNLVMQKATREALLQAVKGGKWRVDPALPIAVDEAVRKYHSCRAPLYRLNPVQKLGFLDESERIKCLKDFKVITKTATVSWSGKSVVRAAEQTLFVAGKSYDIKTKTVKVSRLKHKPNSVGVMEEFYLSGQELAIYITGEDWKDHLFMDQRHIGPGIDVAEKTDVKEQKLHPEFNLEKLVEHFEIPDVPDIAEMNPKEFAKAQSDLVKLEELMNVIAA